jgi:hypothetical protein
MAFVYKSERSYKNQKIGETDSIGPGEYLPQTDLKRIKISKSPFMSNSNRSDFIFNDNPGPGSYYHDETLINYLKNIQNEKISSQNDKVHLMAKGNTIQLQPNSEKLGFLNKEKRFKIIQDKDNVPGPGFYYNNNNKRFKINNNNSLPKKSYEKNYNNLIPTIPSMKQQFGFDVLENGTLVQKQNPDFYKTFSGEKGDTVGPGSYDIETPKNWLKTGTEWSKFRTTRDFNFKSKPNQKSSFNFSLQSTKYSENTNKSKESLNSSQNNNNKKINNKNILNCRIINVKNENKKLPIKKETFEAVIQKNYPGPGYYYDSVKSSQFKNKLVPEFKQFFGSKLERFIRKKENNSLGPGQYFINEINKDSFSKTQKNFAPFSIRAERFSKSVENKDFPGPGNYETQSSFRKKFLETFSKFGSTEKRFSDNGKTKWQYKTPGPGSYIDINTNSTIGKIKEYTLNNFYKNPIFSIYNNINKPHNLHNLTSKKDVIPPIGLYNPDMIYTIDYNVKKRNKENNGKIAFDSGVPKEKKEEKSSLGPGYYYKEKKIIKKQIMPPFNQGDIKSKFLDSNQMLNGPGQYNLDSYYDWNKKSYNVNFV